MIRRSGDKIHFVGDDGAILAVTPDDPSAAARIDADADIALAPLVQWNTVPSVIVFQPGEVFQECEQCPQMIVVPAGSFTMGSPSTEEGRDTDEGPQHEVTIAAAFSIGTREVTFAEWDACVAEKGCLHAPDDGG